MPKRMRERTVVVVRECREPGCRRPAEKRGLCKSGYQVLWEMISVQHLFTWKQAEDAGLCDRPVRNTKQWILQNIGRSA